MLYIFVVVTVAKSVSPWGQIKLYCKISGTFKNGILSIDVFISISLMCWRKANCLDMKYFEKDGSFNSVGTKSHSACDI